jgi:hypothetical protein
VFSWIVTKQWYSNMCFLSNDLRFGTFFTYICEVLWKLNFNNEIFICFILAKYEKENTYLICYGVSRWSSLLFWDTSKLHLTRLLLYISTKATILKVHWSHFGMVKVNQGRSTVLLPIANFWKIWTLQMMHIWK